MTLDPTCDAPTGCTFLTSMSTVFRLAPDRVVLHGPVSDDSGVALGLRLQGFGRGDDLPLGGRRGGGGLAEAGADVVEAEVRVAVDDQARAHGGAAQFTPQH